MTVNHFGHGVSPPITPHNRCQLPTGCCTLGVKALLQLPAPAFLGGLNPALFLFAKFRQCG
jgi:hypothetical protein